MPGFFSFFDIAKILLVMAASCGVTANDQPTVIWMSLVNCQGSEASLDSCQMGISWGAADCVHAEDAGVCCATNPDRYIISNSSYPVAVQSLRLFTRADINRPTSSICGRVEVRPI